MHWVILGAGYTGERLARRLLRAGRTVTITRRTEPALRETLARIALRENAVTEEVLPGGMVLERIVGDDDAPPEARGAVVDLADRVTLEAIDCANAIVACCAPPGDDPEGEMRTLARAARHAKKLVYVSSTGVYAPGDGQWVDERWPIAPTTASGKLRARAEAALANPSELSKTPTAILRVAGIYGPGRGIAERLRAGTYRVIGDGSSYVSRVHVDDRTHA